MMGRVPSNGRPIQQLSCHLKTDKHLHGICGGNPYKELFLLLHSINGLKYSSTRFNNFTDNKGTVGGHNTSSMRYPQSNGAGMATGESNTSHQFGPEVWFWELASHVGWVCWFSILLRDVFIRVFQFFPLQQNQPMIWYKSIWFDFCTVSPIIISAPPLNTLDTLT